MQYIFFVCKFSKYHDYNPNMWVSRRDRFFSEENISYFREFNVDRVLKKLHAVAKKTDGPKPLFEAFKPYGLDLIEVKTDAMRAQEVAEKLSQCLAGEELNIYDGRMEHLLEFDKISSKARTEFINAQIAYRRYWPHIERSFRGRKLLFKLGEFYYGYDINTIDTAVSILFKTDFKEFVRTFNDILQNALDVNEKLYCSNGCFVVENKKDNYRLRFVLEGTGRSPLYFGWMEDGEPRIEMLHRQGFYRALIALKNESDDEIDIIRSRIYNHENFPTRSEMRNPADRFADSYKLSKLLNKYDLNIFYGDMPTYYGDYITFTPYSTGHKCEKLLQNIFHEEEPPFGYDEWETRSTFKVYEGHVVPMIAVIEEIIPYYGHYYCNVFHLRHEEVEMILERIKNIRGIIIKNPSDPSLGEIAKKLLDYPFGYNVENGEEIYTDSEEEQRKNLFKNRFKIVAILDFFSWWLKQHYENGSENDLAITISGYY